MSECSATSRSPMMTKAMRINLLACGLLLGALLPGMAAAQSGPCRTLAFEGINHVICEVDAGADLRLFLNGADGLPYGNFPRIDAQLAAEQRKLAFAMNAGMYHTDRRPVGLHIEDGHETAPLVTAEGPGNFGMLPNGVFCIRTDGSYAVIESRAFRTAPPACRHASQSGPMLVIDGQLHPRFLADSPSRYVRNGVGVSADGKRAVFAISGARVNFEQFARFFRDGLGLPNALYFDGNISRLHAPGLGRSDFGFPMGPIIGLVTD